MEGIDSGRHEQRRGEDEKKNVKKNEKTTTIASYVTDVFWITMFSAVTKKS